MTTVTVMQGDAYDIPFDMFAQDGSPIPPTAVEEIEVSIKPDNPFSKEVLNKTLSSGQLVYEEGEGYKIPLTQQETFAMVCRTYKVQVRVKVVGIAKVIGAEIGKIEITLSNSKEVL